VAALALWTFLAATRGIRQAWADVRGAGMHGMAIGVINGAIPFTLIAWGEQHIDSGVASIANATMPIFNVLLAPLLLPSERVSGLRLVGISLGIGGVAILAGGQPHVSWWF